MAENIFPPTGILLMLTEFLSEGSTDCQFICIHNLSE